MKFKAGDRVYSAKHARTGVIYSYDVTGNMYRLEGEHAGFWHAEAELVPAGDVHAEPETQPEPKAADHGA